MTFSSIKSQRSSAFTSNDPPRIIRVEKINTLTTQDVWVDTVWSGERERESDQNTTACIKPFKRARSDPDLAPWRHISRGWLRTNCSSAFGIFKNEKNKALSGCCEAVRLSRRDRWCDDLHPCLRRACVAVQRRVFGWHQLVWEGIPVNPIVRMRHRLVLNLSLRFFTYPRHASRRWGRMIHFAGPAIHSLYFSYCSICQLLI